MKLSRTFGYAVLALVSLAEEPPGTTRTCKELADAGGMPERFLLQILRSLVNEGVLESSRGVGGGYRLVRAPDSLSLLEVIEAVEGPISCEFERPADAEPEPAETIRRVCEAIRSALSGAKLADFMPDGAGSAPLGHADEGTR